MAVCQRQNRSQRERAIADLERKRDWRKKRYEKLLKFVIPNFKLKCVKVPQHFVDIVIWHTLRSITLHPR